MTLGELIQAAMTSEASPHSNGKFYSLVEVLGMEFVILTSGRPGPSFRMYKEILSVYPSDNEKTMYIDME